MEQRAAEAAVRVDSGGVQRRQRSALVTSDPGSVMTDAVRALIGTRTHTITHTIDADDVRRVRTLLEDDDPRYGDATGIVPPYYLGRLEPREFYRLVPKIMTEKLLGQAQWTFG